MVDKALDVYAETMFRFVEVTYLFTEFRKHHIVPAFEELRRHGFYATTPKHSVLPELFPQSHSRQRTIGFLPRTGCGQIQRDEHNVSRI